jgi:hypothetical protein
MFIPFTSLPRDARIWIYQADRKLNSSECAIISQELSALTESWVVHGTPLRSSFDVRHGQFVILAADEASSGVSGCSIDGSIRVVKGLGDKLGVDFFARTSVCFIKGDDIVTMLMSDLKAGYEEGLWDEYTMTFDNLVQTRDSLDDRWRVAAGSTWLKRYLPKERQAVIA